MIGSEILNEIVNNKHITEADLILNELNRSIKHAFLHGAQEIKDGMDIALLSINKGRRIVEFAGAKNPVVYIQNNELKIIKGNVHHIGGERIAEEKIFTKHVISIAEPTTFYVFSDGFQDQFGGKDGKKYMTLKFRAFLFSIHHLPLEAQKTALKTELAAWKGERVQLDDILVMGVRL
jgi:serine phosphatase RsbU (regulator of sigma subunit)